MSELPKRKHPRLKGFDYSQNGAYFLTLCTRNREKLLSTIVGRGLLDAPLLELTTIGQGVQSAIEYLAAHKDGLVVEKSVVMPNHVHILLTLRATGDGASRMPRPTEMRVPQFVSSLKRYTNRQAGRQIWQSSYHDHVIRDENDFLTRWNYIDANPAGWAEDEYYDNCEE